MTREERTAGNLNLELLRRDLEAEVRPVEKFPVFPWIMAGIFALAGIFLMRHGSPLMGLVFLLGPLAIVALAYALVDNQNKKPDPAVRRLEEFDKGNFSLKEMVVSDRRESSIRDSEGRSESYYTLTLKKEDENFSCTLPVSVWEYGRASEGDAYYVLQVKGESLYPYRKKSYRPDKAVQALLDGKGQTQEQDASKAEGQEPIPIEPEKQNRQLDHAVARLNMATWLNRGLLAVLILAGLLMLLLLTRSTALYRRFDAMTTFGQGLLVMGTITLVSLADWSIGSQVKKSLRGMTQQREVFEDRIKQLRKEKNLASILLFVDFVLALACAWTLLR